MTNLAIDYVHLTRICEFARRLHQLHRVGHDELTQECAFDFAAQQGYDLKDHVHGGCVADWWGFAWMILAEASRSRH